MWSGAFVARSWRSETSGFSDPPSYRLYKWALELTDGMSCRWWFKRRRQSQRIKEGLHWRFFRDTIFLDAGGVH